MQKTNEVVLEQSSNTHKLTSKGEVKVEKITDSILKLHIEEGEAVVTHGEHGVIATESENVIKYVQQEFNPVSKAMINAFD